MGRRFFMSSSFLLLSPVWDRLVSSFLLLFPLFWEGSDDSSSSSFRSPSLSPVTDIFNGGPDIKRRDGRKSADTRVFFLRPLLFLSCHRSYSTRGCSHTQVVPNSQGQKIVDGGQPSPSCQGTSSFVPRLEISFPSPPSLPT